MLYFDFSKRSPTTGKTWAEFCEETGLTAKHMAVGQRWEEYKARQAQVIEHEPSEPSQKTPSRSFP